MALNGLICADVPLSNYSLTIEPRVRRLAKRRRNNNSQQTQQQTQQQRQAQIQTKVSRRQSLGTQRRGGVVTTGKSVSTG